MEVLHFQSLFQDETNNDIAYINPLISAVENIILQQYTRHSPNTSTTLVSPEAPTQFSPRSHHTRKVEFYLHDQNRPL